MSSVCERRLRSRPAVLLFECSGKQTPKLAIGRSFPARLPHVGTLGDHEVDCSLRESSPGFVHLSTGLLSLALARETRLNQLSWLRRRRLCGVPRFFVIFFWLYYVLLWLDLLMRWFLWRMRALSFTYLSS
ncbi:MAG: hypothetical protein FE78DRAFT_234121 [Acidomyces sp. 'richmondensis']|nr:MAG: hypothetical protein FE78DRAFT_234121 [Acidomyces sp. 'richmondensis']